jgi:hypothetical protein
VASLYCIEKNGLNKHFSSVMVAFVLFEF